MKVLVLMATCALFAASANAQVYVKPYVNKNGTYVEGYQRTAPNETKLDNYSTQGNTNPYTGQPGRVDPYAQPQQQIYQQPTYPQQRQPTYGQQCGISNNGQYVCR
jgi:hypothetical protein